MASKTMKKSAVKGAMRKTNKRTPKKEKAQQQPTKVPLADKVKEWLKMEGAGENKDNNPKDSTKNPKANTKGNFKVMKKPAGKNTTKAKDSGHKTQAEETNDDNGRDRLKAIVFNKNIQAFPDWVQAVWADPRAKRSEGTAIVNQGVVRDENVKYKFNLNAPVFEAIISCQF